jgi:hypothetical protein
MSYQEIRECKKNPARDAFAGASLQQMPAKAHAVGLVKEEIPRSRPYSNPKTGEINHH